MFIFVCTKEEVGLYFRPKVSCICFSPTPQVEWVKMGHRLPGKAQLENHGKLLIIRQAEQEDGGKYMCKAKNPLGEAIHYFTVAVEGKRIIQLHCYRNLLTIILEWKHRRLLKEVKRVKPTGICTVLHNLLKI